ncbi:hypothetical protein GOA59_06195 [Sinorhizobium meliloti]|uniref:Uncharacterized protein n=1 Tax=Rhizobium meliloti TaxID=382 RepID=A0A6A8A0N4_RHIML|nr:hypothetical protein [Sinorhizobium meliloti]MDW9368370.1 hypothetical protein [Sinorhizobium meliloti]MDW9375493.1 hypothetical protein [Sinorhizobium meliloti]MDW9386074.1 hypothetical protein [Sinorhizobium meliloti]MDW9390230.1 hypothetical protein [Sinorhizobium meliloti]
MSVIDSKKLRRGMRAENRTHFSSSRSSFYSRTVKPSAWKSAAASGERTNSR